MFVLLSPAKTLVDPPAVPDLPATTPDLLDEAQALVPVARDLGPQGLAKLMKLSEPLAEKTHQRFLEFSPPFTRDDARQAVLSFAGAVYLGLDAGSLSAEDLTWAQEHVGILSGLYGLLRPLDLMQPYRLEMGARLANPRGRNLYAWWGPRITDTVNQRLAQAAEPVVINLASKEYMRSVQADRLAAPVVTVHFQDVKEGRARAYMHYAKTARGALARWIIQNRAETSGALRDAVVNGYRFSAAESSAREWVFQRPHPSTVQ